MKICTKCVTPETAESLKFDINGACSVCAQINFKREKIDWSKRISEFDLILEKYKDKSDYDCIVPYSGGKDSTAVLLLAKEIHDERGRSAPRWSYIPDNF